MPHWETTLQASEQSVAFHQCVNFGKWAWSDWRVGGACHSVVVVRGGQEDSWQVRGHVTNQI